MYMALIMKVEQGDPIGLFVPFWPNFNFGSLLTTEGAQIFGYISMIKVVYKCRHNGLGNILGDFFTNLSGHPELEGILRRREHFVGYN
jgi:hypothetical protein